LLKSVSRLRRAASLVVRRSGSIRATLVACWSKVAATVSAKSAAALYMRFSIAMLTDVRRIVPTLAELNGC